MDDDLDRGREPDLHPPWAVRGRNLDRTLALSDGVFAFAMTLLVLGLALPAGLHGGGVRGYLSSSAFVTALYSYLISFFVISLWWQSHHTVFSYLRSYTRVLQRLNSVFLVFIAVLPFATTVLDQTGSDPIGVVVFALIEVGTGLSLAGVWVYASGPRGLADPRLTPEWRSYVTRSTLTAPVVFAISIPVAWIDVTAAELVWLGAFLLPLFVRHNFRRRGVIPAPEPAA